jgi:hypothetical protein
MSNSPVFRLAFVFFILSLSTFSYGLDRKGVWKLVLDSPEKKETYKSLVKENPTYQRFQNFLLQCAQTPSCMSYGHVLFAVVEQRDKHPDWSFEDVHDELINNSNVSFNVDRQAVENFEFLNPQVMEYVFSQNYLTEAVLLAKVKDIINRRKLCVHEQQKLKPKERVSKIESEMNSYCWVAASWGYEIDLLTRE